MAAIDRGTRLNAPSTAGCYLGAMIDYFAIALTHGLIALAAWRLLGRDALDHEPASLSAPPPAEEREGSRPDA